MRSFPVLVAATALLALTAAAQKNATPFRPGKAADYPSHQTVGPVKIAAVKYESDSETKPLFGGKVNPNEHGVLPILLIIDNAGDDTLLFDRMQVLYQQAGGRNSVEPTDPKELPYLMGVRRPRQAGAGGGIPSPIPLPRRKNPLAAVEFDTRAWGAKSLLKGDSVHGFTYFQARALRNAILYVSGIREASTGKEVFFAEVPLDTPTPD
ncbi:MAG: hypothetical protein KJZ84_20280 [Bryobacteraceae bacterium]|nr:hypothetical protein [Bryobacteraceae bacterium]